MKAQCPHCGAENEGDTGDLMRCVECKKVFEVGGDSGRLLQKMENTKKAVAAQEKKKQAAEQKRAKAEFERIKAQQKECPFCKELVHNHAVVCKHCHSDLDFNPRVLQQAERSAGMGIATFFIILGYIFIVIGIIVILIGFTAGIVGFGIVTTGVGLVTSGFSLVLMSYVAKSTIRTSEYTKIIASKRR